MNLQKLSRTDWFLAFVIWSATFVVFAAGAGRLGFYTDDAGWLAGLSPAPWNSLWAHIQQYIPGRNLHVLWQYLIYKAVGAPILNLPALHIVQSAIDGLVGAAFFLLMRMLGISGDVAVMASGLFAFWPIHGETHFWLASAPMNLLSTLFAILFAMSTLALSSGRGKWWMWLLDAMAFVCALFTYDQVFLVLLLLVGVRLVLAALASRPRAWRFFALHFPHAVAAGFYVRLKLRVPSSAGPGHLPQLIIAFSRGLPRIGWNIWRTVSNTLGKVGWVQVAPLLRKVSPWDWLLALTATVAIAALAICLAPRVTRPPERIPGRLFWSLLGLAFLFFIASYLPIWLWFSAPRHNYLPSVGLFLGAAVILDQLLGSIRFRAAQMVAILLLGGATFLFAAAGRGESRYWEEAFIGKKELFAALKPHMEAKEALALDDFPASWGPAALIGDHDALFGPALFYHGSRSFIPHGGGSIGSVPAPSGVFLSNSIFGRNEFLYFAANRAVVARFTGWENGRLGFEINPARPLPYQILTVNRRPRECSFAVHGASARRDGDAMVVGLEFEANLSPGTFVTGVFSYFHVGQFRRWGQLDREGRLNTIPVALTGAGSDAPAGGQLWTETLRLCAFPRTERIHLDYFVASDHHPPVYRGSSEVAVEP